MAGPERMVGVRGWVGGTKRSGGGGGGGGG